MKEKEIGEAYFNAVATIKDTLANDLFLECSKLGLNREQIERVVFVAKGSVEGTGSRAFGSFQKSNG